MSPPSVSDKIIHVYIPARFSTKCGILCTTAVHIRMATKKNTYCALLKLTKKMRESGTMDSKLLPINNCNGDETCCRQFDLLTKCGIKTNKCGCKQFNQNMVVCFFLMKSSRRRSVDKLFGWDISILLLQLNTFPNLLSWKQDVLVPLVMTLNIVAKNMK